VRSSVLAPGTVSSRHDTGAASTPDNTYRGAVTRVEKAVDALREHALSYPEAWEDFPWEDRVIKVRKKIFVFLGAADGPELSLSVKLPDSAPVALGIDGVTPTAYGLGKSGWVTGRFSGSRVIPVEILEEWIDESYRAVAPKGLVAQLDD
jgi:predicted DNA-binding protein (MmcQ/YjbR family)